MKAGKLVTTLLFALWGLLFLNACGIFDSGANPTPTPTPGAMTVAEAEAKVHQADIILKRLQAAADAPKASPDEILKLQNQATQLRQKAMVARHTADKMREQSRSAGLNPDSKESAPKTYEATEQADKAGEAAASAQRKVEEAKSRGVVSSDDIARANDALSQAKKDLENAKNPAVVSSPIASPETSPARAGETDFLLTIMFLFLLTTVPLLIVIFLLYRSSNKKRNQLEEVLRDRIRSLKQQQTDLGTKIDRIVADDSSRSPQISALTNRVIKVEGDVGALRTSVEKLSETPDQSGTSAADDDGRIRFPMPAEEFLSRMQGNLVYIRRDYPSILLIEDSENGAIALFRDSDAPRGMAYAVPKLSRFNTKQQYHTHYQEYFDCNPPFSGAVTILRAALVEAVDGGWELRERGELRVT